LTGGGGGGLDSRFISAVGIEQSYLHLLEAVSILAEGRRLRRDG